MPPLKRYWGVEATHRLSKTLPYPASSARPSICELRHLYLQRLATHSFYSQTCSDVYFETRPSPTQTGQSDSNPGRDNTTL